MPQKCKRHNPLMKKRIWCFKNQKHNPKMQGAQSSNEKEDSVFQKSETQPKNARGAIL
jgi:hypothetical protein